MSARFFVPCATANRSLPFDVLFATNRLLRCKLL